MQNAIEAARATEKILLMLLSHFVGTRTRAFQITHQKGAPQGGAQDGTYMATWEDVFRSKIEVHKGGNVKNKFVNKVGVWIVEIVEDQGLLLFFGGSGSVSSACWG